MNKWKESFFYKFPTGMLLLLSVYIAGISLVTMGNQKERMNGGCCPIFLILPGGVLLFALILYVAKKIKDSKHDLLFGVSGFFIILFVQLFIVLCVAKIYPITDSFRTLDEAAAMPLQNGLLDNSEGYYAHYTNNYLFTILMYYAFILAKWLGVPYVTFATGMNIFMIDLTILLGYFVVKKMFERKSANIFLLLSALCPTTYVFIYFPYTNTFSMPFIVGIILCGLTSGYVSKTLFVMLSIIGYDLRPTTIFATIGVMVYWFFCLKKTDFNKKNMVRFFCLIGLTVIVFFADKIFINAHLANPNNTEGFPATHWIMVGLNGTGEINGEDVGFTKARKGKSEKIAGNIQVIKKRVHKLGVVGVVKLYFIKIGKIWSIGTDDFQNLNNSDENYNELYETVYGDHNTWLIVYCQIFRCVNFIFIIAMLLEMLVKPEDTQKKIIMVISLLGILLFSMIWETNKKHSICYTSVMLLMMQCGVSGFCSFGEVSIKQKIAEKPKLGMIKHGAMFGAMVLICVMLIVNAIQNPFLSQKKPYEKRVLYRSTGFESIMGSEMRNNDIIQNLSIKKKFNTMKLYVKRTKKKSNGILNVQVLSEDKKVVSQKDFTREDVKKDGYLVLDQMQCPPGKYQVIIHADGDCSYVKILYDEGKVLERYENSSMYFGGKKMGTSALSVLVYDVYS